MALVPHAIRRDSIGCENHAEAGTVFPANSS
jgi:hypothetical protein